MNLIFNQQIQKSKVNFSEISNLIKIAYALLAREKKMITKKSALNNVLPYFVNVSLTFARSNSVSFFPTGASFSSSILTFGITNNTPMAPNIHHEPTTRKGNKNPPAWYRAEPNAGPKIDETSPTAIIQLLGPTLFEVLPNMQPKPNSISVQDMIVDTLFGNNFMSIETPAPHDAASATPSRNLKCTKSL